MHRLMILFTVMMALSLDARGQAIRITSETTAVFATVEEGRRVLGAHDAFIAALSPYDRAARIGTPDVVTEAAFREFVAAQALPWEDAEKQRMTEAFVAILPRLRQFRLSLPPRVLLVKTTGREESGTAYTRANAIMLPRDFLTSRTASAFLRMTAAHELFHVMSRHDPQLRERLYVAIGFATCPPIDIPRRFRDIAYTNPDAPLVDSVTTLTLNGRSAVVAPGVFTQFIAYKTDSPIHSPPVAEHSATLTDVTRSSSCTLVSFFEAQPRAAERLRRTPYSGNISSKLMEVEWWGGCWRAREKDGKPLFIAPGPLLDRVGNYRHFCYQPEEILACAFDVLVCDPDLPANSIKSLTSRMNFSEEQAKRVDLDEVSVARVRERIKSYAEGIEGRKKQQETIAKLARLLAK